VQLLLARKDLSKVSGFSALPGSRGPQLVTKDVLHRHEVLFSTIPAAGQRQRRTVPVSLPKELSPGQYFWCLQVDAANAITETDERNNLTCQPVSITSSTPKISLSEAQIPKPKIPQDEPRPTIPALPADVQLLDLLPSTLLINDEPFGPVTVGGGESAIVSWRLPPDRDADGIYLRVSDREFDTPCSSDVGSFADFSNPDSGYRSGAPTGSHTLSLGNPAYRAGGTYYLKGCLWRSGRYTGDETNTIVLNYASVGVRHAGGPVAPVPRATILPDLFIRDIQLIRSGTNRNHLTIWIGVDYPRVWDPPGGTFPYRVFLARPEEAARTGPAIFYPGGSAISREGVGQIRNLGLFGYGDFITTDFPLPDNQAWVVFVRINLAHEVPSYRESDYYNNVTTKMLGLASDASNSNLILDAWPVSEGAGWALVGVRYALQSRSSGILSLQLFPDADDIGEAPAAGRDYIICTTAHAGSRYAPAQRGVNRRAVFLCRRPEPRGLYLERAVVHLESGAGTGVLARSEFPFYRNWLEEGLEPDLPDLVGDFGTLMTGSHGFGGEAVVSVRNEGRRRAQYASEGLFQVRSPYTGPGSVRYEQLITVSTLEAGQTQDHRVAIPPGVNTEGALAKVVVDHRGTLFETNERNNASTRAMPAPTRAPVSVPPSRVATGIWDDFNRGGTCISAEGGHPWPAQLPIPGGGEVLVGFRTEYDDGTPPLPCWDRWYFSTIGSVVFDLSFITDSSLIENAELTFRKTRIPAATDCSETDPRWVDAMPVSWSATGNSFEAGTRFHRGGLDLPLTTPAGGRYRVDATNLVREWVAGRRTNYGFSIGGGDGGGLEETTTCAAHFGDFSLTLDLRD
jgi:hypothetical protein